MLRSIIPTAALAMVVGAGAAQALTVTQTDNSAALTAAFVSNPVDFSSIAVTRTVGDASQVGTYTGFTAPPVTIGNGVVLSTGLVSETTAATTSPTTSISGGNLLSTAQIDAYSPGKITNWQDSNDTIQITVQFDLAAPSAIAFDFLFGSIEYPVYVNSYTDALYAFLDGTQITFDSNGNPVQVGTSFASSLTTADNNSAFNDPHGIVGVLTTTSGTLLAGSHTLNIAVADTNDQVLDSAVFLANFRVTSNDGGPNTNPTATPEPATMALLGVGLAGLGLVRRRRG